MLELFKLFIRAVIAWVCSLHDNSSSCTCKLCSPCGVQDRFQYIYFIKRKVVEISIQKSLNVISFKYIKENIYFKPESWYPWGKHWICGEGHVNYSVAK